MADNIVISKKERAALRDSINKYLTKIETLTQDPNSDILELEETVELLNELYTELRSIDAVIKSLVPEAQLDVEFQSSNEYKEKIASWRFRANRKIKESTKKDKVNYESSIENVSEHSSKERINVKLPKLNIAKFSGNVADWLSFWSAFETSIHKNDLLDPVDKFNYLRSYLTESPLRSIQGFSVTAENYSKAIDILQDRYGKEDVLINIHMTNLLNIPPLKQSFDTKSLRRIYDEIQSNVRSLESLNISLDTYGNLLCPVLMKLLPRDLVIEFNKDNFNKSFNVQDIITFFNKQLNSRERTNESHNNSDISSTTSVYQSRNKYSSPKVFRYPSNSKETNDQKKVSTACDLLIESKAERETCTFCSKYHPSNKCFFAQSLPFDERVKLLRKKGICFRCLRYSHVAKHCLSNIFCTLCHGKHSEIMCNRETNLEKKYANENSKVNKHQILSNHEVFLNVHLQTLIAAVHQNKSTTFIRVLIDIGSHNSYISKYAADKIKLRKVKTEKIKHGLFGGIQMTSNHNLYEFTLTSLDRNYSCKIQALDQEKICTGVALCNDTNLIETLEKKGVFLSDVGGKSNLCLYENDPEEIHLLLGADTAANLFTENIRHFHELGLTAFETKLGWSIMGKREGVEAEPETSFSVLSLSLHNLSANLSDLWLLDTIGISY